MTSISDLQKCAGATLELSDGISKLNLGLFGVGRVQDKKDEFAMACKVDEDTMHTIGRIVDDGIDSARKKEWDFARKSFSGASQMVETQGLRHISGM